MESQAYDKRVGTLIHGCTYINVTIKSIEKLLSLSEVIYCGLPCMVTLLPKVLNHNKQLCCHGYIH
jgi:hypothetical protein